MKVENFLFEEKYHPENLDDVITSKRIKKVLTGIKKSGNIVNYLFSGPSGCGKTTSAVTLCKELGLDYEIIPASDETGKDFITGTLRSKAQSQTLSGKYRVMILDEADYLSKNAQAALRNVINETNKYCRFILTANYPQKIGSAIRNGRIPEIDFSFTKKELVKELAPDLWKKIVHICRTEGIKVKNKKDLQQFMVKNLPNIRYIIKSIQIMADSGDGMIADISIENNNLTMSKFEDVIEYSYDKLLKFVYSVPQETIMQFILDNLTEISKISENRAKVLQYASSYQQQKKGVEEIYTMSFMMLVADIIKDEREGK